MDCRLHLEAFLGLSLGDAHVISNAGGRASEDAIRSLLISRHVLGTDIDFMPFADLEQSVRDDIEVIREHPLIPRGVALWGYVYDVGSARLRPVT